MAGRKRRTVETDLFAEENIAAEPPAPSPEPVGSETAVENPVNEEFKTEICEKITKIEEKKPEKSLMESGILRVDIPEDQVEEVKAQIREALENSKEIPTIIVGEPPVANPNVIEPTGDGFTGDSVTDEDLYKELVNILSPQKGKRAVPTKIRFWSRYAQAWRHVIIDVNEYLLIDAYKCWLAHGKTDDEEFLDHVYKITKVDVPRMFRVVADLDLEALKTRLNGPMRV